MRYRIYRSPFYLFTIGGFTYVAIYNRFSFIRTGVFAEIWKRYKLKPSLPSGAVLGLLSGIIGIGSWKTVFKVHPNPPAKNLNKYFGHLILARVGRPRLRAGGYPRIESRAERAPDRDFSPGPGKRYRAGGLSHPRRWHSSRCTSLVCHPATPDTVWLGAAGGGVWKSEDAGATWRQIWPATLPCR